MSIRWSVLFPLAFVLACGGAAKETRTGPSPTSTSTTAAQAGDSNASTPSETPPPITKPAARDPAKARVAIFALSDFHGWLLPLEPKGFSKFYGGISNIAGFLSQKEHFDKSSSL